MKRKVSVSIILIFASMLSAGEIYDTNTVTVSNGVIIDKATMKPAEGIYRIYYDSGDLRFEIPLKNGKRNGVTKEFAMAGWLREETPYVDGKINGIKKLYYQSGSLMMEIPYRNGIQEGTSRHHEEDGSITE